MWRNLLIASAGLKLLNPNRALNASYEQSTSMKKLVLLCICSTALTISVFAQAPTASPIASPAAAIPTATTAAIASPSDLADRIHQKLEKKLRGGKHGIITGGDHDELDLDDGKSHEDIPAMVIPLVGIVFLTIFGAPVLIVMMIGLNLIFLGLWMAAIHWVFAQDWERNIRAFVGFVQQVVAVLNRGR